MITNQQPILAAVAASYDLRVGTNDAVCAPAPRWLDCYDLNQRWLGVSRVHVHGDSWSATLLVLPDGLRLHVPIRGRL